MTDNLMDENTINKSFEIAPTPVNDGSTVVMMESSPYDSFSHLQCKTIFLVKNHAVNVLGSVSVPPIPD